MVLLFLAIGASPASAHSVAGISSNNYVTELTAVTPAVEGLRFRIVEAGSRIELTNTTPTEVVVVGYNDEPYLRVGPDGVFENRKSPATYLNASRQGSDPIPPDAKADAEPEWRKVNDGQVARWHDHRIHWMGEQDPVPVRNDPGRRHVIYDKWEIPVRHGTTEVVASGTMVWEPGPSPVPWVAVIVVLAAAVVGASFLRAWGPLLAAAVAVLVVVDAVHSFGIAWTTAGSTGARLGTLLGGSFFNIMLWVVGAVSVRPLLKEQDLGLLPAAIAGVFIAIFGGFLDVAALSKTTVPFAWSADLARVMVAVTIGLGLGLGAGAGLLLWRTGALVPRVVDPDAELEGAGEPG